MLTESDSAAMFKRQLLSLKLISSYFIMF